MKCLKQEMILLVGMETTPFSRSATHSGGSSDGDMLGGALLPFSSYVSVLAEQTLRFAATDPFGYDFYGLQLLHKELVRRCNYDSLFATVLLQELHL